LAKFSKANGSDETMKHFLVAVLVLGMATAVFGQSGSSEAGKYPKVTIGGSEVRSLYSAETGRDYELYVHLPSDYAKEPGKKYPVLYVLDGQWDFKLMDSVLGGLVYDKFVPQMMIVGITYAGDDPDYNTLRAMDLTPTVTKDVKGSGDGPKFYAFLKNGVIPFIEKEYQADASQRVLMGSSYAGLFTLTSMLTDPGMFYGYVSLSPAVSYDGKQVFQQEAEYAKTHKELPVRLFLSTGSDEGLAGPDKDFEKQLESRGYKGLKNEFRVIEGERHASNKPEAYNRGLRFVFSR
jgi:predicted alpha/beta superfamily hydrolase